MKEFADGLTIDEWIDYWRDTPEADAQRKADHCDTGNVYGDLRAAGEEIKRLRKELADRDCARASFIDHLNAWLRQEMPHPAPQAEMGLPVIPVAVKCPCCKPPLHTPEQHFGVLTAAWLEFFTKTRLYLRDLDGDTSRAIGRIVQDIVDQGPEHEDWREGGVARFIRNDCELWHQVANSRKK